MGTQGWGQIWDVLPRIGTWGQNWDIPYGVGMRGHRDGDRSGMSCMGQGDGDGTGTSHMGWGRGDDGEKAHVGPGCGVGDTGMLEGQPAWDGDGDRGPGAGDMMAQQGGGREKGPRRCRDGAQGTTEGRRRGTKGDAEAPTHPGWPPAPCGWAGSWRNAPSRGGPAANGASMPPKGPGPHGGPTAATSEWDAVMKDAGHNPTDGTAVNPRPPFTHCPLSPGGPAPNPPPPLPPLLPFVTAGIRMPTFAPLPCDPKCTQPL